MSNLPLMNVEYLSHSNDSDRRCGHCLHFHPVDETFDREKCEHFEGNCFGVAVNALGVCKMFAPQSTIEFMN
jgi:hypothetical protein